MTTLRGKSRNPLLCAAVMIVLAGAAAAAPADVEPDDLKPCPEITKVLAFALGFDAPVDWAEGQFIPAVVIKAIGDAYMGGGGRLRAGFETSSLDAMCEIPFGPGLFAGGRASGTYISAQSAPYRYDDGERRKDLEFEAGCVGGGPTVGYSYRAKHFVRVLLEGRRFFYNRTGAYTPPTVKPADHTMATVGVEWSADEMTYFQGWQIAQGWEAWARAEYFRRDVWRAWGTADDPQGDPSALREGARFQALGRYAYRFEKTRELRVSALAGFGIDVDALSGIRVGSTVGTVALPGAYYNELACDRHALVEARFGMNLWLGARGWVSATAGVVRPIGESPRGVTGVAVELTQKVWLGIPVTVRYAFSPTARRPRNTGGHELSLLVVAAFF